MKKILSNKKIIKESNEFSFNDSPIIKNNHKIVDVSFLAKEMKDLDKNYLKEKYRILNNIKADEGFNDDSSHWLKTLDELEVQHNKDIQILISKLSNTKDINEYDTRPATNSEFIEIEAPINSKDVKLFDAVVGKKSLFKKSNFGERNYESIGKRKFYNFHKDEKDLVIDRLNKIYEKSQDEDVLSWIEDIGNYDNMNKEEITEESPVSTLSPSKRDFIIAYVMKFSDQLGDYFYDLGNDDLEHHLENMGDKELVKVFKETKEEVKISQLSESKKIKLAEVQKIVEKLKKEATPVKKKV